MKSKQNVRVFWKLVNLQDCVWEKHCRIIMKTILQEKETNSLQHYNLWTKLNPLPQAMKIPAAKAAVDKECEKLEKISAWNLTKVRSKKEVIDEARTSGAKVHFASIMDICHLKNAEFEAKHQKHKGRVVLRGDIVKDNSGSYAVFTEQGSSASQMTAAKVVDIVSRLPGCDGQAADAVSAYTQVTNGRCSQIIENSINRNVQTFGFVYTDTNGLNHGPVSKTQSFLLSGICMVILWAGLLWERQFEKVHIETWMGENSKLGMSLCSSWKRVILICECGWHQIGWKETKHWPDVESAQ